MEAYLQDIFTEPGIEYREIDASKVFFSEELIAYCKMNRCGKYGGNWMCPPAIDGVSIREEIRKYQKVLVISQEVKLEDAFDLEGMEAGRKKLARLLGKLQRNPGNSDFLILGPGTCDLCEKCTYPVDKCKHPKLAMPSLEAIGINVIDLAKRAALKYYHGPNTVTYFAAVFHS